MRNFTFLLDANLSPETATFLRSLGYGAVSLIEKGQGDLSDENVVKVATRKHYVLVTFDLDFGEIYFLSYRKKFSVIILRTRDQRVETVNAILGDFLKINLELFRKKKKCLVVVRENQMRIIE